MPDHDEQEVRDEFDGFDDDEREILAKHALEAPEEEDAPEETDTAEPETDTAQEESEAEKRIAQAEERVKNAQRKMTQATQEAAELRRANDNLKAEIESLKRAVDSLKSPPEPNEFEESFPETSAELKKRDERLDKTADDLAKTRKELENLKALKWEDAIFKAHPDAKEVVQSPEFNSWVDDHEFRDQIDMALKDLRYYQDTIRWLSRFKKEQSLVKPPPKRDPLEDARANATPETRNRARETKNDADNRKPLFTKAQIEAMSLEEYEKREKEIEQAFLDGRVKW